MISSRFRFGGIDDCRWGGGDRDLSFGRRCLSFRVDGDLDAPRRSFRRLSSGETDERRLRTLGLRLKDLLLRSAGEDFPLRDFLSRRFCDSSRSPSFLVVVPPPLLRRSAFDGLLRRLSERDKRRESVAFVGSRSLSSRSP